MTRSGGLSMETASAIAGGGDVVWWGSFSGDPTEIRAVDENGSAAVARVQVIAAPEKKCPLKVPFFALH